MVFLHSPLGHILETTISKNEFLEVLILCQMKWPYKRTPNQIMQYDKNAVYKAVFMWFVR